MFAPAPQAPHHFSGCPIQRQPETFAKPPNNSLKPKMERRRLVAIRQTTPPFSFSGCLNPKRQPEKTKPLGILPNGFLLDRLSFRLPNLSATITTAAHLPCVQPNAASFFREKACACPTAHEVRLVRMLRKKDAALGKSAKQICTSGAPFFARTCIRYLRERILYSVNTNTRRQAKLIVVLLT